MTAAEPVNLVKKQTPADYHCNCRFCQKVIGELIRPDGQYYSRLERRQYYAPEEKGKGGHIAKTPLHVARWAIQQYSEKGNWVLDPTIGAGTTAVEAVTQGRNVAGMELEYGRILQANLEKVLAEAPKSIRAEVAAGDARNIAAFLKPLKKPFSLVVNNPPYSGDVSMPSPSKEGRGKEFREKETRFDYDKTLPNLAFLKEGDEYWSTMRAIYQACMDKLEPGGHFVIGIKDMMRNREPFLLHLDFCQMMEGLGLKFVGTAFLKHYPTTLFLNTYEKFYGVKPPFYQTINVFQKSLKK